MCAAAEDHKNQQKHLFWKFKIGSSRCFKVIDVDTTEMLATTACCDRQHAHVYCLSATIFTKDWPTTKKMICTGVPLFAAIMRRFP